MSEETRDDVGLACFLVKIHDTLEVGMVFGLVGCSSEWHIDMFASDPLIEVVFNLKKELKERRRRFRKKTNHRQHESNGDLWKYIVLGKLGVYDTVIFFVLEPDLIDNSLNQRGTKYAGFQNRILMETISSNIILHGQLVTL
jgi:hypothetical protein